MSQFDDLLADLREPSKGSSSAANGDDFDPFGPSSAGDSAQGAGDSGLLLDFTTDTQNGGTNGVDSSHHHQPAEPSGNPLYDMSAQSSNPLYDLSSPSPTSPPHSGNPLYDLTAEPQDVEDNPPSSPSPSSPAPANPLYELDAAPAPPTAASPDDDAVAGGSSSSSNNNPLYEFDTLNTSGNAQEEVDLLSGGVGEKELDYPRDQDGDGLTADLTFGTTAAEVDLLAASPPPAAAATTNDDDDDDDEDQYVEEPVQDGQLADGQEEYVAPPDDSQQAADSLLDFSPQQDGSFATEDVVVTQEGEGENAAAAAESTEQTQPSAPEDKQEDHLEDVSEQQLPDLIVREEGDEEYSQEPVAAAVEEEEEEEAPARQDEDVEVEVEEKATVEEEVEVEERAKVEEEEEEEPEPGPSTASAELPAAASSTDSYGHDRREEDLEQYCMDREESDEVPTQPREDPVGEVGEDDVARQDEVAEQELPPTEVENVEEALVVEAEESRPEVVEEEEKKVEEEEEKVEEEPAERGASPPVAADVEAAKEEEELIQDGVTVSRTSRTESSYTDSGVGSNQISSNTYSSNQFEAQAPAEPDYRQTHEQDFVNQQQRAMASEPQTFQQGEEEEEEEGVHESQPEHRDDVARESDRDVGAELPAVGTASSMRARFLESQPAEPSRSKREITPPAHGAGGEYVSEPRTVMEKYEGKAEAGVFESQPEHNPEVITSDMVLEEAKPEQGFARNVAAKFREMESKGGAPSPSSGGKREITPDRSGRVEFVSEPRDQTEHYEGHAESGVFESQPVVNPEVVRSGQETEEQLPERGTAKNLAQKFRQISTDQSSPSSGRGKREITPDTSSRVEYVSEPRGQPVEAFQPPVDAGVFENQPHGDDSVVKSDQLPEEYIPERGFAKNVAAKFRELESTAKSPPLSPGRRKEFTPPREESVGQRQSGVYESTPEVKAEVVHSGQQLEEALPERGTAKNMAQRFRQMEAENRSPGQGAKAKKEFTPPPADSGVFENQPDEFQADYNRPAESGIVENQPMQRDDVVRGTEPPKYEEELPERGMARNMVSRWRQMESESAKSGTSPGSAGGGRTKEFTPPRDEPQIQQRSPRTPKSPNMDNGSVHPSELPGQYQPSQEASVFESTPDRRPDVYREDDTDWTEGMPKKDTAKKMLARFQKIQTDAKQQEAKEHTPRKDQPRRTKKVGRSKSMRAAIQTEKCGACEKTVYAMERLEMNKRVYHKACFRCSKCRAVLTAKTFAINNDVIFCTNHYKQMFATKGNYDEGFGRMQHKQRWNSQPNLAEGEDDATAVNGKS